MTFIITVRKLHLAIAVLAVAVLAPATVALADHVFVDVPDAKFYADPVKWALDNDITTGSPAGADTFKPEDPVTRGESVTFLERYHDNVAQPAIDENAIRWDELQTDFDHLALPFAVTASEVSSPPEELKETPAPYVTVSVTAPVDGHVTVNSTALVSQTGSDGSAVVCVITESTNVPDFIDPSLVSAQLFEKQGSGDGGSVSGTRTFEIAAGSTVEYVLACAEIVDGGLIGGVRNLTAIFTPAP